MGDQDNQEEVAGAKGLDSLVVDEGAYWHSPN